MLGKIHSYEIFLLLIFVYFWRMSRLAGAVKEVGLDPIAKG
jgi:uncharacterized membrane protein